MMRYSRHSKNILSNRGEFFEGDGYSKEWQKEAEEKRTKPKVPESLKAYLTPRARKVLTTVGVLSEKR